MLNIANIRKGWFIEQIEALKVRGTPYTEIAASLGIKPQYLNLIKNTPRGASEKLTLKLCETFNLNYNDLLERISSHEKQTTEITGLEKPYVETVSHKRIPLYNNVLSTGRIIRKESDKSLSHSNVSEWIDIGELFPDATSAVRHYGDSMPEYPPGSILILKHIIDFNLIVWGRNYHVETAAFGITKRLQDGGDDYIIGYSSNLTTYPDGQLIHEPVKIPRKDICRIHLILGCVTKEFGEGILPSAPQP